MNELRTYNPDVVLITESRMQHANDYNLFCFNDYIPFADFCEGMRGGGILILVKSNLPPYLCKYVHKGVVHRCNITAVMIGVALCKTVICCAYRPTDNSADKSELFIEHLQAINASADVHIFFGNFSYSHVDWITPSHIKHDGIHDVFQQAWDEMDLTQCVSDHTRVNHTLDLKLISHPDDLVDCTCCPPIAALDLLSVKFSVHLNRSHIMCTANSSHCNYDKADMCLAAKLLANINWRDVYNNARHVDEYVSSFMSVLTATLDQCMPASGSRFNKPKSIMPKVIRKLILKKQRLWKKINDSDILNSYLAAYDDVKRSMQQFTKRRELELVDNPNSAAF